MNPLSRRSFATFWFTLASVVFAVGAESAQAQTFDFDNGSAPVEVIIPAIIPIVLNDVSAGANDATLVLRITSEIAVGWFDAIAPYHPTARGIYSNLPRRPPNESQSNSNKNIAMLYASRRILMSLLPDRASDWDNLLTSVGLDPNNGSQNLASPVGIGNVAGNAVVAFREHDGMNQLGDEGGRTFNRFPYMDSTGFKPVNTAYEILDPTRWQPLVVTQGNGIFRVQQYVTPQLARTRPYAIDPRNFSSPEPIASLLKRGKNGRDAYKQQVDEVLAISASLNDYTKAQAEFFDNKFRSIGFVALFVAGVNQFSLDELVQYDAMLNMAAFDGAIVSWKQKTRWNAVRPMTAVRHVYGDRTITAWGGPGKGTQRLPANEWQSYLQTPDHPEYPSGSSCFCAAEAQATRRLLGSDELGWQVLVPKGQSRIEPGITPSQDTTLVFNTWTDFENQCAQARVLGGVHFQASVAASIAMCRPAGDAAYEFIQRHVNGLP
ncbi:vanadium-dependent haloperoxidase [Methylotetracoccus oryzae]|uniref:vanadium-dependent haloperoxidase n=1 Tax=Methylotetracoccus oryzae TaxID=1919059 RepID=UPI00111A6B65|nr:vanadium-dependent haloperoxidase [Methylotetracoccus oryzae]